MVPYEPAICCWFCSNEAKFEADGDTDRDTDRERAALGSSAMVAGTSTGLKADASSSALYSFNKS